MQFNSFNYIFLLLPVTTILYFLANRINSMVGKIIIILSSLIYYACFGWKTFLVLGFSIMVNYGLAILIQKTKKFSKLFLFIPILINVGLLLCFKYTNFAIYNINNLFDKEYSFKNLILPLGISFFTFQQIAYIIAIYRKEIEKNSLIDYLAFILFFPKILMGPLMDPVDFIAQINDADRKKVSVDNIASGIKLFCFGLFKKVMIADVFAIAVTWGGENYETITSMDAILVMLFYTFEIYFDFSGYSDMATGSALVMNIDLPINFDSPYKAISIRDFWKRWHVSLTKFFTKYIYIPLGGSKKGIILTCVNTMIVFLISGLWHGSNWTFILWGGIHGLLMVFDRLFDKLEKKVFEPVRWIVTFGCVNVLWLLFRADSISQWKSMIRTILFFQNTSVSEELLACFYLPEMPYLRRLLHLSYFAGENGHVRGFWMIIYIIMAFIICLIPENNYKNKNKLTVVSLVGASILFLWGLICLSGESVFIYNGF